MSAKYICPFCSLHCDSLQVQPDGSCASPCESAIDQFQAAQNPAPPRLGAETLADDQLARVSAGLDLSDRPAVQTGRVSVEQAKALHALAAAGQITLSVRRSASDSALAESIARDGTISATLSEVRSRSDLIWVIGQIDGRWPQLMSTLEQSSAELISSEWVDIDQWAQALGQARGKDAVTKLHASFDDSEHLAVVIGDGPFPEHQEIACAESLGRFLSLWNTSPAGSETPRKASLFWLDDHQNLQHVARWRSNIGCDGRPAQIRIGEGTGTVQLQIGGRDPGKEFAHAYLPAATVGVQRRGTTIRGDGSVTLPLSAPLAIDLDDPVDLLAQLLASR